jgi:endonuclease I
MKKFLCFTLFIAGTAAAWAQIPAGYYNAANGYTGYALKTKLSNIISLGHIDNGYGGLYTGYQTTDADHYYENDGTLLDMYSEKPSGTDAYTYSTSQTSDRCGNYNGEGDCYNREHIVPQSLFNSNAPMKHDIQFVIPTDGFVNGKRSNYPYGKVSNPTWTSSNGSKLGANSAAGYSGTVFEPIDEFKGDIARATFYFVTRYQSSIPSFSQGNILDGTTTRGLQQWYADLLLQWHHQDPVSQREIDRNNAAYTYQHNRNPYIDHPEYVDCIWGNTNCGPDTSTGIIPVQEQLAYVAMYPNPSTGIVYINIETTVQDAIQMIAVQTLDGRMIWSIEALNVNSFRKQINLGDYPSGVYILKVKTAKGLAVRKLVKE